jgi:hypothetical protein
MAGLMLLILVVGLSTVGPFLFYFAIRVISRRHVLSDRRLAFFLAVAFVLPLNLVIIAALAWAGLPPLYLLIGGLALLLLKFAVAYPLSYAMLPSWRYILRIPIPSSSLPKPQPKDEVLSE